MLSTAAASTYAVDEAFWRGRRVLVTGLTGFKGSWLGLWLDALGAEVLGCSLPPEARPSLYDLVDIGAVTESRICDLRDFDQLQGLVRSFRPQVVLHLAAQSQVLVAHAEPLRTLATNIMGTAHLLESLRRLEEVQAIVVVTTDKCYRNRGWPYPYRELDELGGDEPYGVSKACAELVSAAYRASATGLAPLATARAGNVLGGGDFASNRLLPDAARAFAEGRAVELRRPGDTRPWQHVLDPLAGYLMLARALVQHGERFARPFNFGPDPADALRVHEVIETFADHWGGVRGWKDSSDAATVPEHARLLLDSSLARTDLGWQPRFEARDAIADAATWYRAWANGDDGDALRARCLGSIAGYGPAGRSTLSEIAR